MDIKILGIKELEHRYTRQINNIYPDPLVTMYILPYKKWVVN